MCKSTLITQTTQWTERTSGGGGGRQHTKPLKNHLKLLDFLVLLTLLVLQKVKAICPFNIETCVEIVEGLCIFRIIPKAIDAAQEGALQMEPIVVVVATAFGCWHYYYFA